MSPRATNAGACALGFAVFSGLATLAVPANAKNLIRDPMAHPVYAVELEPQLVSALWHRRFSHWRTSKAFEDPELGVGFRATIEMEDPAFVPTINNNVGLTLGLVFTSCDCREFGFQTNVLVGAQWSFWFTERLSAFAEAGPVLRLYDALLEPDLDLFSHIGGRVLVGKDIALTLRLGYPHSLALGASFFVGD
ncbi:MAG: hypothetical protein EXR75_04275 [Myxococcales bacterium]|nr:hypothetical protein [Myxococcales bacterium]